MGHDNGDLLIDHFLTMSQIKCAYYTQNHKAWADLIGQLQGKEEQADIKPLQSTNLKEQMS